jgi:DNA polymerase V
MFLNPDDFSVSAPQALNPDCEVWALPYFGAVRAGFPSPAADYIDQNIDLNKELIAHPSATFFVRIKGHSMKDAGMEDGDVVLIDRAIKPNDGKIALCCWNGEFTIKRLSYKGKTLWLLPANDRFAPIEVSMEMEMVVWGIVTYIIKKAR